VLLVLPKILGLVRHEITMSGGIPAYYLSGFFLGKQTLKE
jgi:hypothetical protein